MNVMLKLANLYLKFNRRVLFGAENIKKHRDMEEQSTYLSNLKEPENEYERAFLKYKCHSFYHYSVSVKILYNLSAIIFLPIFALIITAKSRNFQFKTISPQGAILIVSPTMGYEDILPHELPEIYGELQKIKPLSILTRKMDHHAWFFFRQCLKRYWYKPYFCFEALIRIAGTCELIYKYQPKAIIGYGWERDFIGPILLEYCKKFGIDRISFMHGTFVYSIDKAYLSFSKYYVWEEYYVKMFTALKADPQILTVYTPLKYDPIVSPRPQGKPYEFFLTYYFSAESKERLERIKVCLDALQNQGLRCKLRPHPRFTDQGLLKGMFPSYLIEDEHWSLAESMECSRFIAAYNSTVLTQAFYSKKEIVIDDYVDPSKFQNMIDRNYIMLSRPHYLMTDIVKQYCGIDLKV